MEQKTVTIEGIALNYYTTGSSKQSIVFVHANSYNGLMWRKQFADSRLSDKYHLVAVDVPGHGSSARLAEYDLPKIAALLPKFIAAVTEGDNIVVGLSMGSALLALGAPDIAHCKGLFMASPNLFNEELTPDKVIKPSQYIGLLGADNPSDEDLHHFVDLLFNDDSLPEFEEYKQSYRNTDGKIRQAILHTISTGNYTDMFASSYTQGVPVEYFFGADDKAMHVDYLSQSKRAYHGVAHAPKAGHFVNIENTAAFNDALLLFADKCFGN